MIRPLQHQVTGWRRRRNLQAVGELIHDGRQTGEGQDGDEGKGQLPSPKAQLNVFFSFYSMLEQRQTMATEAHLQALQHIEEVVHARQVLDVLEDGHKKCGSNGQRAGQQNSRKS